MPALHPGVEAVTIPESRPHFHLLDGLRGIAAFAVVLFHFMEWVYPDINDNFIGHGFLAVDFFFCLSGFVIAYAYDSRFQQIGIREFFKARLIRLHPLVVLGSVLGLLGFLFDPFAAPLAYGAGQISLFFLCSVLLIPYPMMEERGFNLFSFNAPAWSLFWEYVANIFYALVLVRLSRRWLLWVALLAAAALVFVSYRAGNLLGGWSKDSFFDGAARVAYSFIAGMLLYRFNWIIKNQLGFPVLAILLFLAFLLPGSGWNWLTELLVVLIYFPLLVSLGAGSVLSERYKRICVFSGNISYPLYMTHYVFIWIFGNYYLNAQPAGWQLFWIIAGGCLFLIFFAWLAMRYFDRPVRKFLSRLRGER